MCMSYVIRIAPWHVLNARRKRIYFEASLLREPRCLPNEDASIRDSHSCFLHGFELHFFMYTTFYTQDFETATSS